jgi:tetratricopeptide (TPR) repeat protein
MAHAADASGPLAGVLLRRSVDGVRSDIDRLEKLLPDHLILLVFRFELAKLLLELSEPGEADELFARVLADTRKSVGLAHPKMLVFLESYAPRLVARKRAPEARALFAEVEAANRERFGPENPWRTLILLQRAAFEQDQGANKEALARAREAVALIGRGKILTGEGSLSQMLDTAKKLGASGDPATRGAARELFAALRPLVAAAHGEASTETVIVLVAEGRMLYNSRDRAAAAASFERALALLPRVADLPPIERVNVLFWCGRL